MKTTHKLESTHTSVRSQKFRVPAWTSYRTHEKFRVRYVLQNSQKFRVGVYVNKCCTRTRTRPRTRFVFKGHIPVPRVLCNGRTKLTEVPVRVIPGKIPLVWFRTYRTKQPCTNCRLYAILRSHVLRSLCDTPLPLYTGITRARNIPRRLQK